MKKITNVKYGVLFLGTVLYLFLLAYCILPEAAKENRRWEKIEYMRLKKEFNRK